MSATETLLFLLAAAHGAVIVWLCFERDRMLNRIEELELK